MTKKRIGNKIFQLCVIEATTRRNYSRNSVQHHHGLSSQSQPQQQPQINFFQNSTDSLNFLDDRNLRLSQDKREILQYLNTKNVIKTMLKLLFGTNEESMVTSRQVLNVFVKMLEVLKSSFGQRARSTSTTSRLRDTMDNAAQASISMIQGYVKSVLQTDKQCIKRSICESASNAARESRELGNLIAQIGGYATSYMLENQRSLPFGASFEAIRIGRNGADCRKAYKCMDEI
uniref:Uncharacterized protein LOC113795606 isoform X2 n=1 Tax=Dermatophagoides pteronyssinus TaxID=6956 RepID=A0A6P6YAI4_DERPT|nr:uncharacterized protein LOC113795606 isoform X2 [Dermatophagoides pteronyssinus]